MTVRKRLFGLFAAILVFVAGCGKMTGSFPGLSSKKEKGFIGKAKRDFLSPDREAAILDFAFGAIDAMDSSGKTMQREYENCKVTGGKMFDYFKLPKTEDEYWAVELEFVGNDKETKKETKGIAILQYFFTYSEESTLQSDGTYLKEAGRKKDLMGFYCSGREEEIKIIRMTVKKSFDSMKAMGRMMR